MEYQYYIIFACESNAAGQARLFTGLFPFIVNIYSESV